MRRPVVLLALIASALASCGSDEQEDFAQGYRPVNDELLALGGRVSEDVSRTASRSGDENSAAFGRAADRAAELRRRLGELDPPEDLNDRRDALAGALDRAVAKFVELEKRSRRERLRPRALTRELVPVSRRIDSAQNALAESTGARVD